MAPPRPGQLRNPVRICGDHNGDVGYGADVLVKWVRCEAVDREGFARGQQAWAALRELPGFLGQHGGWSRHRGGAESAHVIAFWSDADAYEQFMAGPHDTMAAGQVGTFRGIQVGLFERLQEIGTDFAALRTAGVLRLAHCRVKAHRVAHFAQVQQEVWNPGMGESPGFLGGVFAQRGADEFLVLTGWASTAAHARYQSERFPALRDRADPSADLETVTGHLVELEPRWSVPRR